MTFYDEMRGVADELLGEFKQGTVTLSRTVTAEPDPATPWIPGTETTTTYPLDAVVKRVDQRYENGVLIVQTGDIVTFAVPAVVPAFTDKLVIDGIERVITSLRPTPAAGVTVAWKAFVAV